MKKILYYIISIVMLTSLSSCQEVDTPKLNNACTLTGLKAYIYYDESNLSKKQEVNLLSGTFMQDRGYIEYDFIKDDVMYTESTLAACRLEATIPSTATAELLDLFGKPVGKGLGGTHNLCDNTIMFRVVAADGTVKNYQLVCNLK